MRAHAKHTHRVHGVRTEGCSELASAPDPPTPALPSPAPGPPPSSIPPGGDVDVLYQGHVTPFTRSGVPIWMASPGSAKRCICRIPKKPYSAIAECGYPTL